MEGSAFSARSVELPQVDVVCSAAWSASSRGRWRQLGDLPWASARMRCFIVGGRDRVWAQSQSDATGAAGTVVDDDDDDDDAAAAVCSLPELSLPVCVGPLCAAAAVPDEATKPSVVHSARKAVTMAVHSFMTRFSGMGPLTFRLGDLRTFLMMCMGNAKWWTDPRGVAMFG